MRVRIAQVALSLGVFVLLLGAIEVGLRLAGFSYEIDIDRVEFGWPDPEVRDPQRAYELAESLFTAEPLSDYALLAARALSDLDRCSEAAKLQEAVARAADEAGKAAQAAELRKVAERYASGPPCREDGGHEDGGSD